MSESSPATGMHPIAPQDLVILPQARGPRQMRVMPIAESILWSPTISGTHRPAPLMFFAQHSLRKVHDRLTSVPNGLGIGLLTGRDCTCSRSSAPFVLIDGALPLPALRAEDEPIDALAEGMRSVAPGIQIVGWYRGHSFSEAALTPSDVDAQTELFGDKPCIVLVVSAGGEAGAVFRRSANPAWPVEALPFYEWVSEPATMDEPKPTVLGWRNYRASESIVRWGGPVVGPAPISDGVDDPVFDPDADIGDDEAPHAGSRARWYRRFRTPARYVAWALGGALLVSAVSAVIASTGTPSGSWAGWAPDSVAVPPATSVVARRADALSLALTAFGDRVRMFEGRQMTCAGLSRGLEQVEDEWLAYNLARKATVAPFDSLREARDRSLYADVRSVVRRFERSGCARP